MTQVQVTKRSPFSFERKEGKASGTVIFRFCGPFTARDMYASLPPVALQNLLNFQSTPGEKQPTLNILDLTDVPYVDSSGLGMIVRHYVRCQGKGIRFVAAGASSRVLELFKITKVDGVLPLAASVEDADVSSN
jgi:anti-anti-sigma factor